MAWRSLMFATAVIAFSGAMYAQELPFARSSPRPGVWHGGTFLGYVPAHERHVGLRDTDVSNAPRNQLREVSTGLQISSVEPAAFQTSAADAELPAPENTSPPSEMVYENFEGSFMDGKGTLVADGGCIDPGWWGRGEYLHWWTDSMHVPPLVSTGSMGTAPNVAGVLGQTGTQVLLGNGDLGGTGQSGARLTIGWWFDPSACRGLEANYFGLGQRTSTFTTTSAQNPILARPVFDTGTNTEAAMLVAHPDFLTGSIAVDASTELQGVEALYRYRFHETCDTRLDFVFGYRFARLDERLRIEQSSLWTMGQGGIAAGTTLNLFDQFETDNQFHGGEIGLAYTQQLQCWSLDVLMKLGLGNNHAEVVIDGQTINVVPPGGGATFTGGLLAQQTNIGRFERDSFAFMPELAVGLHRDLACNLRLSIGYNLLYWTAAVRPGDQIDRHVSQFPPEAPMGTQNPAFRFQSRGFLAQGLQLGLEYQF